MASIRIPQAAESLLPLCRRHERSAREAEEEVTPCFETYADLLLFAAGLGFAAMNGGLPLRNTRFSDKHYPIDLAIFKNNRRYPQLLLIALAVSGDRNVVRDEDHLCKLTEEYAAVGCERLARLAAQGAPGQVYLTIAKRLAEESASTDRLQI